MKSLKIYFIIIFIFLYKNINALTCNAITGSWNTVSTWSCGRIPQGGDIINIPVGVVVSDIPANFVISGASVTINIFGTLDFGNSGKLTLPVGSDVNVNIGGLIKKGNGSGSNNIIDIGGSVVWNTSCGNVVGEVSLIGGVGLCEVLPLDIIYFDVYNNGEYVYLNFGFNQTSTKNLVIEKSYDLINWENVMVYDDVRTMDYKYNYVENGGMIYYRVKQINYNGEVFYTKIESIRNHNIKKYSLCVENDMLSIILLDENVYVKIYKINGNFIGEYKKSQTIYLDRGVYIISIFNNGRYFHEKVVVE
jgi:hypothetical protein